MKKLIVSVLAVAALAGGGAAFADAESQAGSAWDNRGVDYGPVPGTPEYYGNSGFPPVNQIQVVPAYPNGYYANGYGTYAQPYGDRRAYRNGQVVRGTPRDRDGDGVSNRRDRWPDDARRW